jgi:hypothetical protein
MTQKVTQVEAQIQSEKVSLKDDRLTAPTQLCRARREPARRGMVPTQ